MGKGDEPQLMAASDETLRKVLAFRRVGLVLAGSIDRGDAYVSDEAHAITQELVVELKALGVGWKDVSALKAELAALRRVAESARWVLLGYERGYYTGNDWAALREALVELTERAREQGPLKVCVRCSRPVEDDRQVWAVPACHACTPPLDLWPKDLLEDGTRLSATSPRDPSTAGVGVALEAAAVSCPPPPAAVEHVERGDGFVVDRCKRCRRELPPQRECSACKPELRKAGVR